MNRTAEHRAPARFAIALTALGLLAGAGLVTAQTATTTGGATTGTATSVSASTRTAPEASTTAGARAQAESRARLAQEIETKSAATAAAEVEKNNGKMTDAAHKVDTQAAAGATDQQIAGRLATEFHLDAQALLSEKQTLDVSWGNLMIAHTLSASAKDPASATVENLVGLHKDGMGWGKIAAGLGFKLGPAVAAVEAESRVAAGEARATGRAPHIALNARAQGDPDAAGADDARAAAGAANAAAHASARAEGAAAHVDAGLHVGHVGGK